MYINKIYNYLIFLKKDEWEKLKFKDNNEKKALSWNFEVFIKGVSDNYPYIKVGSVLSEKIKFN
jgi:hypothetical protein